MPRRRQKSHTGNGHGYLTPGTHISLTLTQAIIAVLGLSTVIGGYIWLKVDASSAKTTAAETSTKVDVLATKVEAAAKTNNDALKDQDAKREELGKDFLAKQDQLNAKVTELTTSITVQQHDTATIASTLAKISDQLSTAVIAPKGK